MASSAALDPKNLKAWDNARTSIVDIVIVTASGKPRESGQSYKDIDLDIGAKSHWPIRQLLTHIPKAWIATYPCDLLRLEFSLGTNLVMCGRHLLDALQRRRGRQSKLGRGRPFLLVGDVLGSLVIQQVIIQATSDTEKEASQLIAGISLLGAPPRDSTHSGIQLWCQSLFQRNPKVLNYLLPQASTILGLMRQFWNSCGKLCVLYFFWKGPTLVHNLEGPSTSIDDGFPIGRSDASYTTIRRYRLGPSEDISIEGRQSKNGVESLQEDVMGGIMMREFELSDEDQDTLKPRPEIHYLQQQDPRAYNLPKRPRYGPPLVVRHDLPPLGHPPPTHGVRPSTKTAYPSGGGSRVRHLPQHQESTFDEVVQAMHSAMELPPQPPPSQVSEIPFLPEMGGASSHRKATARPAPAPAIHQHDAFSAAHHPDEDEHVSARNLPSKSHNVQGGQEYFQEISLKTHPGRMSTSDDQPALLGDTRGPGAEEIRPRASTDREEKSPYEEGADFMSFVTKLQELIRVVYVTKRLEKNELFGQQPFESDLSTGETPDQALQNLLDADVETKSDLHSCSKNLEAALVHGRGDFVQILLQSNVDTSALLHHSIRQGRFNQTRCIAQVVSNTSYRGMSAAQVACFHSVRAIAGFAAVLSKRGFAYRQVWQTLKDRVEICCLFKESDMSPLGDTGEFNLMFQELFEPRWSTKSRYSIHMYEWEIPELIMDWKSGSALSSGDTTATVRSRFFDTITISGCGAVFEAMTCKQYLARSWGDLGIKVADMILEFISTTREDACISQSNDPHTKPVITHSEIDGKIGEALAYAFQSHLYLVLQDVSPSQASSIQNIAEWLCKTFRQIHSGHITGLQASRLAEIIHSGTLSGGHEYVAFALSPLIPLQVDRASCWMSLFETGIVAETPVRRDVALEGLEMSFELMTSLAAVETYHYIQREGNATEFILLGFFTALIPTLLHDSGTISWHFEYSDTDVLRPMDLQSTQKSLASIKTPADLAGRRCVVGMWPQANIMLGVEGTGLDFEDSGLPHRSSVLKLKGFEATAALGVSGGPVQGIMQATRTYEHHVTRQRFTRSTAYVRALDHLSQAVALVYDCKTHIGWLVPQTSLLLHLCHAYYARLSNIKGQIDPIPWAKPSTDGASAATAAFRGSGDIVVSEVGDQTDDQLLLRQLLVSLNSSLQVTQDTRQLPKKIFHWTKGVYFSELQDQILEPDDGSALRVLDPAEWPSIKAWLEITKKVDGLLVCRNLDQAIALVGPSCSPHNQSPQANANIITNNMNSNNTTTTTTTTTQTQLSTHLATCSSCAKVPEGRGYLVAHAWCLQNVLKRPSPIASKNMATWIQNGKPFDVHLHASNESIWAHPEKVLQSFAKPERGFVCNKTGGHTVEGAVVFGKYGEESLAEWLRKVALSP